MQPLKVMIHENMIYDHCRVSATLMQWQPPLPVGPTVCFSSAATLLHLCLTMTWSNFVVAWSPLHINKCNLASQQSHTYCLRSCCNLSYFGACRHAVTSLNHTTFMLITARQGKLVVYIYRHGDISGQCKLPVNQSSH